MQRRFNEGRYWERLKDGEFTEVIIAIHPNTAYPEVLERHRGAVSVTAHYRDQNDQTVAEVHYFRMPDGSVAPGMRPDPKLIFEDGVMYHMEKQKARIMRLEADAAAKYQTGTHGEEKIKNENAE